MSRLDPEQGANLAAVAELLRRQRPMPTFDELERVDRRLNTFRASRRTPGRRSRFVVAICLSLGLLFMTAGTGLAIDGFATPGPANHAQYPDRTSGGQPGSATGTAKSRRVRHSDPSSLGEIQPSGRNAALDVSLTKAETRGNLPFAGLNAIPILAAGLVLIMTGAGIHRRTRGSRPPM